MTRFRRGFAAGVVSLLVLGVACSGADEPDLSAPDDATPRSEDATSDDPSTSDDANADGDATDGERGDDLDDETYFVAESLDDELVVRDSADPGAAQVAALSTANAVSGRIVCRVVQQVGEWVEVDLPAAATSSRGWVSRDDVAVSRHRFRIEVARAARTLTLYSGSVVALSTPIALGPDAPPPGDDLFITELVQPPDPTGPYGPYAYGLSASINDLAAFASGRGVVAVHGLNDPALAGTDLPAGSVGVAPDIMARMAETIGLPLGTPVDVVA